MFATTLPRFTLRRTAFCIALAATLALPQFALASQPASESRTCADFTRLRAVYKAGRSEDASLLAIESSGISGASGRTKLVDAEVSATTIYSKLFNAALPQSLRAHSDTMITRAWSNLSKGFRLRIHGASVVILALSGSGMTATQKSDLQTTSSAIDATNAAWAPIARRLNGTYGGC